MVFISPKILIFMFASVHLTRYGFQIYKKEKNHNGAIIGRSFFINSDLSEREETQIVPDKRGKTFKEQFIPVPLLVRPEIANISALKQIAVERVIAGRPFSFVTFTCMHFVYKFVLTIAQNAPAQMFTQLATWPKVIPQ
jgi:hypothetical protein